MIKRNLNIIKILEDNSSSFIFGPRGVGKSVLSQNYIANKPNSISINLLHNEDYRRYLLNPELLRKEVQQLVQPGAVLCVLIDEIQKVPAILDEVHSLLMTNPNLVQFILTGSSARKLKKGGANLLAGRALTLKLHPLSFLEVDIDLDIALQFGTLPEIYLKGSNRQRKLKAYIDTYLKEEIKEEALVRKVDSYYRFLELAAQYNGSATNYKRIADKTGVSPQTVKEYYSILTDTLIAFAIPAWSYSIKKQIVSSPKHYFFDCGVLNAIKGELGAELKSSSFRYGDLFENYIICEINKLNDYFETDYNLYHWRTNTGQEVDLILSRGASDIPKAIEIKSSELVEKKDLIGLRAFKSDNPETKAFCLCRTPRGYQIEDIQVLPWQEGIEDILKS